MTRAEPLHEDCRRAISDEAGDGGTRQEGYGGEPPGLRAGQQSFGGEASLTIQVLTDQLRAAPR